MRPSENGIKLWPLAVVGFFGLCIVLSFSLRYELRAKAPDEFRRTVVQGQPKPALADEYWKIASDVIQWKYPLHSALPSTPPRDFVLPPEDLMNKEWASESARLTYWTELRKIWPHPEMWRLTVNFDPTWMGRSVRVALDGAWDFIRRSI
jgi:hypothetical protein